MSITVKRAQRHVTEWSTKLAPFPTRVSWPAHLFHTCQLEVAVEIIRSGNVICRSDVRELICDVANQGALWNNPDAHRYVRLYFRPRNGFHLKTEGVKSIEDPHRVNPHMSIPIAFAFDFQQVLTSTNSSFVPGNFARIATAPLTGDSEFDTMPFEKIYHDAPLLPDVGPDVRNWRMSEVVVRDSLELTKLSCVICRTIHEERTLRYALKDHAVPKIIVEQKRAIFFRKGIFIDEIYWASDLLHFHFHGPTTAPKEQYAVLVKCWDRGIERHTNVLLAPGGYRFPGLPASKEAIWRIEIEGCVVYHAPIPSTSGLVTA